MSQPNSKQIAAEKKKAAAKPRGPKKVLSAADTAAKIAKMKAALAALEQKAYGSQLDEAVVAMRIGDLFAKLKGEMKGVSDLAILASIGKAAGIKRLSITQAEVKPRKPAASKAK